MDVVYPDGSRRPAQLRGEEIVPGVRKLSDVEVRDMMIDCGYLSEPQRGDAETVRTSCLHCDAELSIPWKMAIEMLLKIGPENPQQEPEEIRMQCPSCSKEIWVTRRRLFSVFYAFGYQMSLRHKERF